MFSFGGQFFSTKSAWVGVYVNGVRKLLFYDDQESEGNNHHSYVGPTWTLVLSVGDEVYLKCDHGQVYANGEHRVYFNGFLIKSE